MGGKLSYPHTEVSEDRTYLITGGNTGIGYQTAKSIAKLGGRVVIACRSEEKAKEAVEKMQKEHQEEVKKKRADEKAAAAKEKAKAEKAAAAKAAAAEKEKAAAAKKEAAEKAAAAKKEEAEKAAAAKKEEDKKEDAKKEGDEAKKEEDAPKEDAPKEDAPKEDAPKEDAPKEEAAAKEDPPKEEAAKEDPPTEDGPKEEPPKEDAPKEEANKPEENQATEGATAAAEGEATEEKKEEKKEEPEEPEEPIATLNVEFMILDLASFESTMKFIEAYKAKGYPLHVLICNAGFGAGPKETSADGYEMHFQVNYLSHFLMTLHLLPLLRQSAPNSRIVNVSSTVHTHGVFNLENVNGEQSYDRLKFYGNSKMYQIMNMYAFERRLKDTGISVFSVHPGYVDSEFNRGTADNKLMSFMDSLAGTLRMKRNVQDGAMTTLVAALDTAHDGKSAIYFKSCKPSNASALSRKLEHQEALWKFSVDLLKEKGHLTDELLTDLTLPEPEPTGENKPEGEAKEEDAAAATAGGDAAEGEKKTEEAKEEKKEEGGGDASEKKEEVKEEAKEEAKEEPPKEEEKKEEAKEEENKEEEKKE